MIIADLAATRDIFRPNNSRLSAFESLYNQPFSRIMMLLSSQNIDNLNAAN
jgi:hypothetical protein